FNGRKDYTQALQPRSPGLGPWSPMSAFRRQRLDDYKSLGIRKIISDGEVYLRPMAFGNEARQPLAGSPREDHGRLARRLIHHPQVAPEHTPAEAGSQSFGTRFLRGIALGVGRGPLGPSVRLAALGLGEDAIGETFAIALERLLDPPDVDHVIAETNDHLRPRLPGFTAGTAASSGGSLSAG